MMHKIRKTGEVIYVVAYNCDTERKDTDRVSYVDSSGIEHVNEKLNYYWDLEILSDDSKIDNLIDWDKELIEASKLILSSSINKFDNFKESVEYSIECASYLIDELKNRINGD